MVLCFDVSKDILPIKLKAVLNFSYISVVRKFDISGSDEENCDTERTIE